MFQIFVIDFSVMRLSCRDSCHTHSRREILRDLVRRKIYSYIYTLYVSEQLYHNYRVSEDEY